MNKHLFIIGLVWPEPDSTAAGTRMIQLIQLFQCNDYKITFASAAAMTDKSYSLDELNIDTVQIELNDSNFDAYVKCLNPSIVLFDRFLTEEQYGWRIDENCPYALKILDTEDLHFLRDSRQQAIKKNTEPSAIYLHSDITKREIASIYRCDISLIISNYEYELLIKEFEINSSILHYLPFLQDEVSLDKINSYPTFEQRNHFMTIGNFKHQPNLDAVIHLKINCWPIIKKNLPYAEIHIYGAYATDRVLQLNKPSEGFYIKGWTDDLVKTYTSYKVCLAPIQFGAGLKGKLIDSMVYGTPSVTTSVGAEGIQGSFDWNGFIENDIKEFAMRAIELHTDKNTWLKSQQNGIEIINQYFNKILFSNDFIAKINSTLITLSIHRTRNFTGSILKHHTLRSTKYLSKWIEEKDKTKKDC